jgi:uncharacterized protein YjbI with pentapeptide repeats
MKRYDGEVITDIDERLEIFKKEVRASKGSSTEPVEFINFKLDFNTWNIDRDFIGHIVGWRFINCDLRNIKVHGWKVNRCFFKNSILMGMDMFNCDLFLSRFVCCNMFSSKLYSISAIKTVFSTCNLDVSDISGNFNESILSNVFLRESDISHSTHRQSRWIDVILSSTIMSNIDLRGCIVSFKRERSQY